MRRTVLIVTAGIAIVALIAIWWLRDRPSAAVSTSRPREASLAEPPRDRAQRSGDVDPQPRVLVDDDPRGTLRLEGQVIDADEHGVAGATVILAANPPRTQHTEADGSFAFDNLVGRPYTLVARGAHGVAGPVTARLTATSGPVVLRLRPAAKLTVAVVGRTGAPFDGAIVELRGVDVERAQAKAGVAVFAPVVPGGYQIAAWADGMAHTFERIQIGSGDAQARLVLAAGAAVTGRVVDDRGAGVAGARVRYGGASNWTQQASDRYDAAVSEADGSFRFDALPAGSFRFSASHPERAPGTSALVTLDGKTQHDGVTIALSAGAIVAGHVVDAQHHPVASARVRIAAAAQGFRFEVPRQAYSDAQGAFEIRGLPRKALSVVAAHESGASQTVAVDATAGDVSALTLTLDVTGTISGVVLDPDGQPVEGAQVTAGPVFGGGGARPGFGDGGGGLRLRGIPQETSDAAGKFTLTGLAPGQYRLTAAPAQSQNRRRGFRDGVTAAAGDRGVKLVVAPDGSVAGRVAFSDGTVPDLFSVSVQDTQQSFMGGDGKFALEGLAPSTYQLEVRGPGFLGTSVTITIASSKVADAGTITVVKGRSIGGVVVASGQPVAGATVYAGRMVTGNGTTSSAQPTGGPLAGAFGDGTKTATTDASGGFTISGLAAGDLTVVAEQDAVGRSRAMLVAAAMPGQAELTLSLEPFGALSGTLHQANQPAGGVPITCQSTSTPGAVYTVLAGADGSYRFDRLAPDVYKVSAVLRLPRFGAQLYSQQVTVPPGQEVTVDLTVAPGTVALDVTVTSPSGPIGAAAGWLASGSLTARTFSELSAKMAANATGTSTRIGILNGEPAHFTDLTPGGYSVCITPLPREVKGMAAIGYLAKHGDTLATFCSAITVAPSPDSQTAQIAVAIPTYIPDAPAGPGAGSGS